MRSATNVRPLALLLGLVVWACGGDEGTEPDDYLSVAGTFTGEVSSVSNGWTLDATLSVTLRDQDGKLSGDYLLHGTLGDGQEVFETTHTGPLTGSVSAATNPSLSTVLTFAPYWCPQATDVFRGTYDSANRRLNVTGDVVLRGWGCEVIASFPGRRLTLAR